jgi:hypothetical protein
MASNAQLLENIAAQAAVAEYRRINYVSAVITDEAELGEPEVTYDDGEIVLATIKDVPLVKVGMEYPASTGKVDFSLLHLSAVVDASADPLVPRARVKLGHTDPRYNEHQCPSCKTWVRFDWNDSYTFDGDPGFGFVENCRLVNSGGMIEADLVDVPLWLAKVMPVAFASRSIEGWFGYKGPNQKEYDFVITDLALLGVCFPGVMNLPDLPKLYGSEQPDFVVIQEAA